MRSLPEHTPEISVVVPALNEAENLPDLADRLREVLAEVDGWELVVVDDGSTDESVAVLDRLHAGDPRIRYVSLSRNFGHQAALRAGIEHARGRCVATMDADLQHPPELLLEMLGRWRRGDEIVTTIREDSRDLSLFKRKTGNAFYTLMNFLGDVHIEPGSADFFLIDRKVVERVRELPERDLFFRGLLPWLGYRRTTLRYTPGQRTRGETKYSLRKMMNLALSGVLAHSLHPLRVAVALSALVAGLAGLYALYSVVVYFTLDAVVTGWTSIIIVVSMIGALQLLVLGIIGEYLGRAFRQVQGRPPYIVRASNIDPSPGVPGAPRSTSAATPEPKPVPRPRPAPVGAAESHKELTDALGD